MSDNISPTAASRRESARTAGGRFGTQPRSEAHVDLGVEPFPDLDEEPQIVPSTVVDGKQIAFDNGAITYLTTTEIGDEWWTHRVTVHHERDRKAEAYRPPVTLFHNGLPVDLETEKIPKVVRQQMKINVTAVAAEHDLDEDTAFVEVRARGIRRLLGL